MPRHLAILALLVATPSPAEPSQAAAAPSSQELRAEEVVVLETTLGTMVFRLFDEAAPKSSASFRRLVADGFYDGLPFYRVVAGHVIQAGDGGENDEPTVPAELGVHPHLPGALGLARGEDLDSGSTEIYVCLAPRPHLDGRYTIFGDLIEGEDVLAAIGAVPVEERFEGEVAFHRPLEPVLIRDARLETRELVPPSPPE